MVKLLCSKGADLNMKDKASITHPNLIIVDDVVFFVVVFVANPNMFLNVWCI